MNSTNLTSSFFLAFACAALFVSAPSARAQNGFRVSTETGLELNAPALAETKKAKPAPVAEERKVTEITATGETSFDAKAGTAIFSENVKVTDPQFGLTCDKLTVFMKKSDKTAAAAKEAPKASPSPIVTPEEKPDAKAKKDDKSAASGLERAIAEGRVIITQDKADEKTGEVTHYVGKAAKAEYNSVTGEMVLSGWPQIQQGFNTQAATEEGTVMILDREGHMRTKGPSMTVIKSDAKSDTKPSKNP